MKIKLGCTCYTLNLFFYYYYLVCEAIGIASTPGLLCQPRVIVKMIVEKQMECRLAEETEVFGESLPQLHFCPSQNPTWPDPGLNPGCRRLTAWAMARPSYMHYSSPIRATCFAHLILLDLIIVTILGEEHKLWYSSVYAVFFNIPLLHLS
jgi:hypothetical protein